MFHMDFFLSNPDICIKREGFSQHHKLIWYNTWPDRLLADVRIFGWLSLFGQIFFWLLLGLKKPWNDHGRFGPCCPRLLLTHVYVAFYNLRCNMFGCFSKRKQTPNIKYLPIHVGSMYMCIKRIRRLPKGCDFFITQKGEDLVFVGSWDHRATNWSWAF